MEGIKDELRCCVRRPDLKVVRQLVLIMIRLWSNSVLGESCLPEHPDQATYCSGHSIPRPL